MKDIRLIPARIDRRASGGFRPISEASVSHINNTWGGTILARYYKGASGSGDNIIIVQSRRIAEI